MSWQAISMIIVAVTFLVMAIFLYGCCKVAAESDRLAAEVWKQLHNGVGTDNK